MSTGIQWTDETWNPVVGCTPVSPGCLNCYAAAMARRLEAMGNPDYAPRDLDEAGHEHRGAVPDNVRRRLQTVRIAEIRGGRAVFTGDVRCLDDRLAEPLHWRKPRRVFVNSMSDLFHERVSFEFIDRVFAVMALCPQHTFQVLTKRPERMAEYLADRCRFDGSIGPNAHKIWNTKVAMEGKPVAPMDWPLPNVWLGTSVEDQARADQRIPHLIRCDAAVRFLSCEPLLGEVDLSAFMGGPYVGLPGDRVHQGYNFGIDWVIVGGESGHGARVCEVEWIESIVRQCREAGVPCFVKQLGSAPMYEDHAYCVKCGCWDHADNWDVCNISETNHNIADGVLQHHCGKVTRTYTGAPQKLKDRKGGVPAEWPEPLRVQEYPRGGVGVGGGHG